MFNRWTTTGCSHTLKSHYCICSANTYSGYTEADAGIQFVKCSTIPGLYLAGNIWDADWMHVAWRILTAQRCVSSREHSEDLHYYQRQTADKPLRPDGKPQEGHRAPRNAISTNQVIWTSAPSNWRYKVAHIAERQTRVTALTPGYIRLR